LLRFSLQSGQQRQGVNFETRTELSLERSTIPPSLYLARAKHEPWSKTDEENVKAGIVEMAVEKVDQALFATPAKINGCYFVEYRKEGASEYSRSVFVTG
jgi:hypothetical protein